jgi:phosphate transport system protein
MRKLISFGKNSFIVSLPKLWVDKNKLKKGDLISIEEGKEGLLLRTSKTKLKEEPKRMVIDAENKNLIQLKTEIVSAYLNNYHIIEVISKELKTNAPEIRGMLRDLAGLEIINQSSTRIVAKDLINIGEISIKTLIRRMDNITRAMMEDAVGCFEGEDHVESLAHIDEEVNRLHFLAYRVIRGGLSDVRMANSLGTNPLKLHSSHTVTKRIERIADNTKRICRYLRDTKLDKRWAKELKVIFEDIKKTYSDVMKAYYTNDEKIALGIEEKLTGQLDACDNFFAKHNHKSLKYNNGKKAGVCGFRAACGATTKIIENMKEMLAGVKYIARTLIGGG